MIQKLLNDIILEEDRKKREEVSGKGITGWRSSGLGSCMRGRFLDRVLSGTGIKPEHDPRTLRVFEMGNQVEEWLVNSLEKNKEYKMHQQVEMFDPELNLSGHLDVMLFKQEEGGYPKDFYIVECKSKHSKAFWYMDKKGEGAQIHHKMQLHSYLYMLNKYGGKLANGVLFPPQSIKEGCILYVSKDDMAMLEYPVMLNDKALETAWKYEIETLNKCWKDQTAPPANEPGSWQEKYCKFCEIGICQTLDDAMVKDLMTENPPVAPPAPYPISLREEKDYLTMTTTVYKVFSDGSEVLHQTIPMSSATMSGTTTISSSFKFKIGDRVKVKAGLSSASCTYNGKTGTITKVEWSSGKKMSYYVLDIPGTNSGIWEDELEPASIIQEWFGSSGPVITSQSIISGTTGTGGTVSGTASGTGAMGGGGGTGTLGIKVMKPEKFEVGDIVFLTSPIPGVTQGSRGEVREVINKVKGMYGVHFEGTNPLVLHRVAWNNLTKSF